MSYQPRRVVCFRGAEVPAVTAAVTEDPKVARLVDQAATEVKDMFGWVVDLEDLKQHMWLWVVQHEDKVPALAKGGGWYLVRRLKDAGILYGRKEKAQRTGYSLDDEYHYSMSALVRLLPDALDAAALPPQSGPTDGGRSGSRTYNEWEAGVCDVRVGLDRLSFTDFTLLRQLVQGRRDASDPAVRSALCALQSRLGGPR